MANEVCSTSNCPHPRGRGVIVCDCCHDSDAEACVRFTEKFHSSTKKKLTNLKKQYAIVQQQGAKITAAVYAVLEQCHCEERSCETCAVLDKGLVL